MTLNTKQCCHLRAKLLLCDEEARSYYVVISLANNSMTSQVQTFEKQIPFARSPTHIREVAGRCELL